MSVWCKRPSGPIHWLARRPLAGIAIALLAVLTMAAIVHTIAAGVAPHSQPSERVQPRCRPDARIQQPPCKWSKPSCCLTWQGSTLTVETDALVADPTRRGRVIAGTITGAWISTDAGHSWTPDRRWVARVPILALSTGAPGGTIVAGGGDGAVYLRPSDPGLPWRRISPSLSATPIFSLAVDPRQRVVLAGTSGALYRGQRQGDRWRWQRVLQTQDSSVTAIVWSSSDPRRGYASVFGSTPAVWSTDDEGRTWHAAAQGLPTTLPTEALATDPDDAGALWLSTMGGGVWRRSTSGLWSEVDSGLPERHAMPLLTGPGPTLYAGTMGSGIYDREQGGRRWNHLGRGLNGGAYIVLSLAQVNEERRWLLAGTSRGLYRYPL